MGMAACGHCVLIGGYQRKNGVVVPVRGVVALGDVVIQEDHFVLADEGEILPEPLQLDVREPGMVFRAFFLLLERVYVVHAHEMHVADIERIPTRPQCLGEGFAGVIHGILVVVACRCVIGHPERSHYPLVFQVALPVTPGPRHRPARWLPRRCRPGRACVSCRRSSPVHSGRSAGRCRIAGRRPATG